MCTSQMNPNNLARITGSAMIHHHLYGYHEEADQSKWRRNCLDRIGLSERFKGFRMMGLKDFLELYQIPEATGVCFPNEKSHYEVLVLVDCRENVGGTMSRSIQTKCRKSGKQRRRRLRNQYNYTNVYNRIHGFVALEDYPLHSEYTDIPEDKKVLGISLMCASSYSNKKGIGSELMKVVLSLAKQSNSPYTDVVLEAANEYADVEEEEEEEEEEEGMLVDEVNQYEDLLKTITKEFSRKILRVDKSKDGLAFYNVDSEYVYEILYKYLLDEDDESESEEEESEEEELEEESEEEEEESEEEESDEEEDDDEDDGPGEYEYGGFWYNKGKKSQKKLLEFYERWGFKEDPSIHKEWGIFGDIPFPSMYCSV
mgnify:CR=1 FL=1